MQTSTPSNTTLANGTDHPFLRVIPWRVKKRCSVKSPPSRPLGQTRGAARTASCRGLLRAAPRSRAHTPQSAATVCTRPAPAAWRHSHLCCGAGHASGSPSRPTPYRLAAARQLIQSSTAASARDSRSTGNGLPIHASAQPSQQSESDQRARVNPLRLSSGGNRSEIRKRPRIDSVGVRNENL